MYVGNVPGHCYENTYCPECDRLLIQRHGFSLSQYRVTSDKRCPHCGTEVPIIGEAFPGSRG